MTDMEKQYEDNQQELEELSAKLTNMNCQMQIHLKVGMMTDYIRTSTTRCAGDPVEVGLVHKLHAAHHLEARGGVRLSGATDRAAVLYCLAGCSPAAGSLIAPRIERGPGFTESLRCDRTLPTGLVCSCIVASTITVVTEYSVSWV